MTTITTRATILVKYEASQAAASIIAQATGPARHAARVEATLAAATQWLLANSEHVDQSAMPHNLAWLLILELHGVGGPLNAGGKDASTSRILKSLGKGRWQASDGAAYRAAALAALTSVSTGRITLAPLENGSVQVSLGDDTDVVHATLEPWFARSLAIRGILATAEETLADWSAHLGAEGMDVQLVGDPIAWGAVVDTCEQEINSRSCCAP